MARLVNGGSMKAQQVLLFLGVAVVSAILGYAFAYAISSEWLIHFFAGSGSGEWERGVVENGWLHGCCSGPMLLVLCAAFATLAVLSDRVVKMNITARCIILAALTFIAAFVAFFPMQVLLLMGAAF
jgi:hypothetical protein